MSFINVEIKARIINLRENQKTRKEKPTKKEYIRNYLQSKNADYKGIDLQTDTYFNVKNGRLKLREGNIENNLIYYERGNKAGPKNSYFQLVKVEDANGLKETLTKSVGVKIIVNKKREIYYIGNVKFHLDEVAGLGDFVEIEAGNILADLNQVQLQEQCEFYLNEFNLNKEELIEVSYSDMLLSKS